MLQKLSILLKNLRVLSFLICLYIKLNTIFFTILLSFALGFKMCLHSKWFAKKLLFVKDIFIYNKLFAAIPKELIIYQSDH